MTYNRKIRNAGRMKLLSMAAAMLAAAMLRTSVAPGNSGDLLDGSPAAKVISVSGRASVRWAGRSHSLVAGDELAGTEVVATDAHSRVLVEMADGEVYRIFPGSRVRFCSYWWTRPGQLNRWLGRIKAHIQRFGGLPPSGPHSRPTAVLAVRAATRLAKGWIEIRS